MSATSGAVLTYGGAGVVKYGATCLAAWSKAVGLSYQLAGRPNTIESAWAYGVPNSISDAGLTLFWTVEGTGNHPHVVFCEFGASCPFGGTLSGTTCVAPACPLLQVRDPETGQCGPTKPNKALGPACQPLSIGNPCNAGTGTKYQVEDIYSGGTKTPLV